MGNCSAQKTEGQARSELIHEFPLRLILTSLQTITVIPKRNRLRLYIDGPDKYYRLRELKRVLPEVVVKVCYHSTQGIIHDALTSKLGCSNYPARSHQYQGKRRCKG
jgi:hypothetical protein